MFIINIERLEGVELVLKALRESGCIASGDLADGIEQTLLHIDEATGDVSRPVLGPEPEPTKPGLRVVR